MTITVRILGWKSEGLRCPDHDITCCDERGVPFAVALIQMPNGTGKTTTLNLMRAAFSGSARNWDAAAVQNFRKRGAKVRVGAFELRLSLNQKRLTVLMEFDFEGSSVTYKTTFGAGQETGFVPPLALRRFMTPDFVDFFIFDGELAEHLLDVNRTRADQAVESLFQIHLLTKMRGKVQEYWDEQTKNFTAKDQSGYTRRRNLFDKWTARREEVEQTQETLSVELASIRKQMKAQKDRYDREINKEEARRSAVQAAENKVGVLRSQVRDEALGNLDAMRDPHAVAPAFAALVFELKAGLDKVKLPESAAREFFEELAEERNCVCGRPIDDEIKAAIRARASQYLGSQDVQLLNAMKSAISDAVGPKLNTRASEALAIAIDSLGRAVGNLQSADNDLSELKSQAEASDPKIKSAKEEIDRLKALESQLQDKLARFAGKDERINLDKISSIDPAHIFAIETLTKVCRILDDQLQEIRGTLELRAKRDALMELLSLAHGRAKEAIAREIRDEANDRINALMPNNGIRIDAIERCLRLKDQEGGSAGETLSVGYAFLATLFKRAEQHELPFVVDSPANPIDLAVRPNIGALLPQLTGQLVAFVISSERARFLPSLKVASKGSIQFVTLFRKGISDLETKARAIAGTELTADGLRVPGEPFFTEFQLDSEEAT